MSKKLLLGIIIVLLITNIASLLFWNNEETVGINDGAEEKKINSKEPVASIGNEYISYEEWMQTLRSMHGEKQLKMMIDRAVVRQLAEENNIEVHEKVMEREIALLTSMQGVMTEEEFAKKQENWREEVNYRYQLEQLLTMDTEIPEEKLRTYYDEYKNQYNFTASMQLSHIIVQDYDTAEKVINELKSGASFELLAQEYSLD